MTEKQISSEQIDEIYYEGQWIEARATGRSEKGFKIAYNQELYEYELFNRQYVLVNSFCVRPRRKYISMNN